MIVAIEQDDTAFGMSARIIAMLERIARPIDPGTLAIPCGKHAIISSAGQLIDLLRAGDGSRR